MGEVSPLRRKTTEGKEKSKKIENEIGKPEIGKENNNDKKRV